MSPAGTGKTRYRAALTRKRTPKNKNRKLTWGNGVGRKETDVQLNSKPEN